MNDDVGHLSNNITADGKRKTEIAVLGSLFGIFFNLHLFGDDAGEFHLDLFDLFQLVGYLGEERFLTFDAFFDEESRAF